MVIAAPTSMRDLTQAQSVSFEARPPLRYDILSIDVGITPSTHGVPGVMQYAVPVKPVSRYRYSHCSWIMPDNQSNWEVAMLKTEWWFALTLSGILLAPC